MKYLRLFVFSILLVGKMYAQEWVTDTSYVLMPPISESCKNIVFTDSMYRAWNTASVENIRFSLLKDSNDCLEWIALQFIKGENGRLSFCKTLNNDSIITKEDFIKGFIIIEDETDGHAIHTWNYLIVDRDGMFKGYFYKFNGREVAWDLKDEKLINKYKFYGFFNKIKKCKKTELMYIHRRFIVTKFTEDKIESYVLACEEGCKKCIEKFYVFKYENNTMKSKKRLNK